MALVTDVCYAQPLSIEAPNVTPLPYGLFSIANFLDVSDPHWQTGVQWEPERCGAASLYRCPTCVQNDEDTAAAKEYVDGVPLELAAPFTVYSSFSCSPIGNWDRAERLAREALRNGEERAVEAMLADGVHATSRALTNASSINITPTPGTAVTVQQGLALLEQYIGENGKGQGAIVGSRRDILLANATGKLITREGDHLETILGTPVAALSGFNGKTGPNNIAPAANAGWLFGLGSRPYVIRGEEFLTADREYSLNTSNNDLKILAERNYVLGWDCFTVGVLVTSIGSA